MINMTNQDLFIEKVKDGAIAGWHEGSILPSVTIAQAILESSWGTSDLAVQANNYFGIKVTDDWKGDKFNKKTAEYTESNEKYYIYADFRKYRNIDESMIDHTRFFHSTPWRVNNYNQVIGETDYKKACQGLQNAGYATSKKYASQLIGLIEMYKLYEYDKIAKGGNNSMRIFLSVGHSILKGGGSTSANGIINEYQYNKALAPYIKKELENLGHICDVIICPEGQFTSWTQERGYKLPIANNGKYDLICELHLNASNGAGRGTEVFYYKGDGKGKAIADRICLEFEKGGFKNRGSKNAQLYMVNDTYPTAVLVESFFCDNKIDCDLAKALDYQMIARMITRGLVGQTAPLKAATPPRPAQPPVEKSKIKYDLVTYTSDVDGTIAKMIEDDLGIPTMHTANFEKVKDKFSNVIHVGANPPSKYSLLLMGGNRDTTREKVLEFIKKNK